jgi:soluble lytic murein transglycosylase-like protein
MNGEVKIMIGAGILAGFLLFSQKSASAEMPDNAPTVINAAWVKRQADALRGEFSSGVDTMLVVSMVKQESDFRPQAQRNEYSILNPLSLFKTGDASIGLMQVLTSTAIDLYNKGYKKFGVPTIEKLKTPPANIYFGMAYIDWLQIRARRNRVLFTPAIIAEWYNAGYGNSGIMSRAHSKKVMAYYSQYQQTLRG